MIEVIVFVLKVLLIQGILYLFYRVFLRSSGHHSANRIYLFAAILVSFVIPLIELPEDAPIVEEHQIEVAYWLNEPVEAFSELELVPIGERDTFSLWKLVPWLYGLVVSVLIAKSLLYIFMLVKLKSKSELVQDGWFKLYRVIQNHPFSFFSSVFIPRKLFGEKEFDQILTHECEHVRQFHSMDRLLMDLVVSLFWFNPFIYLYRNALIEIHEFQADAVVLEKFGDPIGYQEVLYSQLATARYSGLVSHFNFSTIKKRIVMMNKTNKKSPWLYALVVPCTLLMVFAFSSREAMTPISDVGGDIAAILGPEKDFSWQAFAQIVLDRDEPGSKQDHIPSILPVRSDDLVRLTSGFGMQIDPFTKVPKRHVGVDFACPIGTEILATADGEIVLAEGKDRYGLLVEIDHGNGFLTRYAHLSAFKVKRGDQVQKGQMIALSGNSGRSTAPHLHYEVKKDGDFVNPIRYVDDHKVRMPKKQSEESYQQSTHHLTEDTVVLPNQKKKGIAILDVDEVVLDVDVLNQGSPLTIASDSLKPLIVLDGVKVSSILDLSPGDIDRIVVLKGKKAKKKYGDEGEDGVVEIYTKKSNRQSSTFQKEDRPIRVLIDPGHGGQDPGGSTKEGVFEKQIVLGVAKLVGEYFEMREDVEVVFTREGDDFVGLKKRAELTQGADLLLSLHLDQSNDEEQTRPMFILTAVETTLISRGYSRQS